MFQKIQFWPWITEEVGLLMRFYPTRFDKYRYPNFNRGLYE